MRPQKARHRQAIATYVNQELIAYGDVEDALTDLHAFREMVADLPTPTPSTHLRTIAVSPRCNTNGLVDYLFVRDAERTLLANQLSLAQTVSLHLASIHLIKALGGGWDNAQISRTASH